ncbi:RNA polymerase sigma factor [Sulfitobacter sp. MF3-043]|uniref:RNA polymerase sigma factor n=1 Tax=Sulfitobacter sediminivivens TaxID=3252902 RepID=UPI0036DBE186
MSDPSQIPANVPILPDDFRPVSPALELALKAHYIDFQRYLLRRVGDKATAEDVLHSFCIRVMQSETRLRDERSALGWLYTVLKSVLMDHFRKETVRNRNYTRYSQERMVLETDRAGQEENDTICNCLRGLLPDLRPEYAEILRRVDFLEEPRKLVAADMGVSQENLRVRLHRARGAIGVALKQHCGACCETEYRDCFCQRDCTDTGSLENGEL